LRVVLEIFEKHSSLFNLPRFHSMIATENHYWLELYKP